MRLTGPDKFIGFQPPPSSMLRNSDHPLLSSVFGILPNTLGKAAFHILNPLVLASLLILASACHAGDSALKSLSCNDYARTPIVFVHGSGLSASSWDEMISGLGDAGYSRDYLHAVEIRPSDGDNVKAARTDIADGVKRVIASQAARLAGRGCPEHHSGKVDIVAHSMGAFSARWYVRFIGPENVRTLITLAGANHGTDKLCDRAGIGDKQMCPAFSASSDSSVVQIELNGSLQSPGDETPFGMAPDANDRHRIEPNETSSIRYFTIRLDPDFWIKPADSAILHGAGGSMSIDIDHLPIKETSPGNFLFTGHSSHDGLTSHPAIIDFVSRVIQ